MADFSGLKELDVQVKTVPLKLHQIQIAGRTPTLHLAPATEANPAYFNKLLKRAGKQSKALTRGTFTSTMLQENRDEDRRLYPATVIKSWSGVVDTKTGEEVPFSEKECREFCAALPDWIFDEVRDFAANPTNFVEAVDADDIAGNSSGESSTI